MPGNVDDDPVIPPPGRDSLPPPELGLDPFVQAATKAVKKTFSDAVLKDVKAVKGPAMKSNPYTLVFSARFRVQNTKMVTATGDGSTISKPTDIPMGQADVKSLTQATAKVYALVGKQSFIGNIELYNEYTLFRPISKGSADTLPLPDQPYFDFRDKNGSRIALLGASDEKVYATP